MLDENLPCFFLKPSTNGVKHHRDVNLTYQGSEPAPAYLLQYADPASPSAAHKNCYAAALFDAWNPDVLFGEVLARPGWTQPSLSADEARRNGGVPPPPQPILPTEFVIQLYNPDQQVRVEMRSGKWGGSDSYEFSMPQDVFRTPSASTLDRGQSDPASLPVTPRINFAWKKESRMGKDLTCFMTGKSTDEGKKRSARKDPDIAVGLWRNMRELTIYEPNLSRVEMEDPKGLEVTLILSAIVIKDLYFGDKSQMRELFNISDTPPARLSSGGRKLSNPRNAYSIVGAPNPLNSHPVPLQAQAQNLTASRSSEAKRTSLPRLQTAGPQPASKPPPMADARAQWELDAETARLKAQAEAEHREVARRRQEKEKADEMERRRLQKMVEEEEKAARKKQADIDRETDRLRKLYGVQPIPARPMPPAPNSSSSRQQPHRPKPSSSLQPIPQGGLMPPQQPPLPQRGSNGLYIQPAAASASSVYMSGGNGNTSSLNVGGLQQPSKKKSFFGLRSHSDDGGLAEQQRKLAKKQSAMW